MKVAATIIAYNEAQWIRPVIRQFRNFNIPVFVLCSTKPWNGVPVEYDGTVQFAQNAGAEVIVGYWPTEHEQRNYGLAICRDFDWVLIADGDELYTQAGIETILSTLSKSSAPAARTNRMRTYWKTTDYVFDPPDRHEPIIAVRPQQVQFYEHRQIRQFKDFVPQFNQELIPVTMHHMSWVKSDEKVREKIDSFSHSGIIKPDWYNRVWKGWTPEMDDIRPYGIEVSKAVYSPAPQELTDFLPALN